jgi:hypothetical protein
VSSFMHQATSMSCWSCGGGSCTWRGGAQNTSGGNSGHLRGSLVRNAIVGLIGAQPVAPVALCCREDPSLEAPQRKAGYLAELTLPRGNLHLRPTF